MCLVGKTAFMRDLGEWSAGPNQYPRPVETA
jgi:hypothetical protein